MQDDDSWAHAFCVAARPSLDLSLPCAASTLTRLLHRRCDNSTIEACTRAERLPRLAHDFVHVVEAGQQRRDKALEKTLRSTVDRGGRRLGIKTPCRVATSICRRPGGFRQSV